VLARYAGTYRIDDKSVRRVIKAGSVLYAQRDNGRPFAIRPSSETEFFYESLPSSIRFETQDGKVTAMLFKSGDGTEQRAVRE
ncbi:MAG TPA: hypothetical protein VEU30_09060, partial [Thermoanaerobaculia bacterium]|nr:hypothetical protein [Thermoanaerobaculia bacterium]